MRCFPPGTLLAGRKEVLLRDLKGELFVGAPEDHVPGHNRWFVGLCRKAGFRPRFTEDSNSLAHALSLVVTEQAVALVPGYVKDMPVAGVVMRPIADPGVSWDFYVVWQRGRVPAPVRVLVGAL